MAVVQIIDNGKINQTVTDTLDCGDLGPVELLPQDITLLKYIGKGGAITTPTKKEDI